MIDFHAHVLPNMDDGSHSVEESLAMLRASQRQGVSRVIATPHFYAQENTPQEFLRRRQVSWSKLASHLMDDGMPTVSLGAEVRYFQGISQNDEICALRIEGTSLLLLEMPFTRWTDRILSEVLALQERSSIQVVLAHIERYFPLRHGILEEFQKGNILFQANADFFLHRFRRRQAFLMLRDRKIHLLGSDCHDMKARQPRLGMALEAIRRKLGPGAIEYLERTGMLFTEGATPG